MSENSKKVRLHETDIEIWPDCIDIAQDDEPGFIQLTHHEFEEIVKAYNQYKKGE